MAAEALAVLTAAEAAPIAEAASIAATVASAPMVEAAPAVEAAAEPAGLSVRFRKPAGWAEPLYVHYWATDPGVAEPVWPGIPMTDAGDGWWAHYIEGTRAADLVFNDNSGNQTGNLHRDRSGRLGGDGGWVDDEPA